MLMDTGVSTVAKRMFFVTVSCCSSLVAAWAILKASFEDDCCNAACKLLHPSGNERATL